jgi:Outer membrane efflux protein
VTAYQNTVLTASQEVENGLVTFLRAQERTKFQAASVTDAEEAVKIALGQYQAGTIDFTRVTQLEQALVLLQDTLAQARGEIALGLIQVYRALGGGWQIRFTDCDPSQLGSATHEQIPMVSLMGPRHSLTSRQPSVTGQEQPGANKPELNRINRKSAIKELTIGPEQGPSTFALDRRNRDCEDGTK